MTTVFIGTSGLVLITQYDYSIHWYQRTGTGGSVQLQYSLVPTDWYWRLSTTTVFIGISRLVLVAQYDYSGLVLVAHYDYSIYWFQGTGTDYSV